MQIHFFAGHLCGFILILMLEGQIKLNYSTMVLFRRRRVIKVCFYVKTYRGRCGLRELTAPMSTQMFLLLSCCRPTTLHLKHRVSGQYTFLNGAILWVHGSNIGTFDLSLNDPQNCITHQSKEYQFESTTTKLSLCLYMKVKYV